jgi:2-octaprenyl-6-methoxyphenol hydroxylase
MSEYRDIVIAGGGMVGVSLALHLAAVLPRDTSLCMVEGFPLPQPVAGGSPDYHPSFDARSTALSYSSRLIYQDIGVWDALSKWLCPIERIHVSSRGHFGSALLEAGDYAWEALGYVVENAWLGNALIQSLYQRERVELISPARVVTASPSAAGVNLQYEGETSGTLQAGLLVVADGADSGLRRQLGVAVEETPYGQQALIANVGTAQSHRGCAFERFTDQGPIAMLPLLPAPGGDHRSALVWTLPPEQAAALLTCPQAEFLAALQERFGYRLGRLRQAGERHAYPLTLTQSAEQVRQGIVVMGNAAHALHPVAGQGFNLALRDVAQLATTLAEGVGQGARPGDLSVLQAYQGRQQADQARTIEFSHHLPGLFMHPDPVLGVARDVGLAGLDVLAPLKREFVRYAAGVAGMGEPSGV